MSTGHGELPRGTRIHVGVNTTVERLLFGPTSRTDGTENLVGAIRTSLGMCGAQTVHEFHDVELIVAPSVKTEGKRYQLAQQRLR
jgi:IMP dehydrogenase